MKMIKLLFARIDFELWQLFGDGQNLTEGSLLLNR